MSLRAPQIFISDGLRAKWASLKNAQSKKKTQDQVEKILLRLVKKKPSENQTPF